MTHYVSRTCTEIGKRDSKKWSESPSRPLEDFRETDAFVLLGAPGAGKTEALEREARLTGGCPVTARDFVGLDNRPKWHDATLFIDGLDEMRAGSSDGRTPLDRIRNRLNSLGCPRFRLSCREADWFGANDRTHLKMVSRDGKVRVLRLDPLSEDNIREILRRNTHIHDAGGFIASARERGIDGLLPNPQSLQMLADAVDGGHWPETRMETFDLACRALLKEHNREHQIANPDVVGIPRLMNEAGRLCAVQLLAGNAGYTLTGNGIGDPGFPALDQIPGGDRATLRYVLSTKLFEGPSEGRVAPVHRQVAEFLAAKYLASRISEGLPIGRILALTTGDDGVPVSELRGLTAWLAAHSKTGRSEIITRDPLGTILYGDVRDFSTHEKRRLLERLEREATQKPWFWRLFAMDARCGDIATPDMGEAIRETLRDSARDDARQSFVRIVLLSLKHSRLLPGLADPILEIVRDESWSDGVRVAALDALIRQRGSSDLAAVSLRSLLTDITAETVSDANDDLLGSLLIELYPKRLSSSEILRYFRRPKNTSLFGRYHSFWSGHVPAKSTTAQCGELLDGIAQRFSRPKPVFLGSFGQVIFRRRLLLPLMRHLLQSKHEEISPSRLLNWLKIVSDPDLRTTPKEAKFIRDWLGCHSRALKEVISLGVKHCANSGNFRHCMYKMERCLFDATWPPNWCLEQALVSTDSKVAKHLICKVADFVRAHPGDKRISREDARTRLVDNSMLLGMFNELVVSRGENNAQLRKSREQDNNDRRQRQKEWCNRLKAHETALRENRCHPALLYHLAAVYFGLYVDAEGDTPIDRLQSVLGTDENLIQAVLEGLRGSIDRKDLPDASEIMRLGIQDEQHLALAFMAGVEEAIRVTPDREYLLDETQMRLALTIHYESSLPYDVAQPPTWFSPLLKTHPDVVADVLVKSFRSKIKSDPHVAASLNELAYCKDHTEVARLASLRLLKAFPVRCRNQQLPALACLLEAALHHSERTPFLRLIERKLAYHSMNVGQCVYWLVAGLRNSPDVFLKRLKSYVTEPRRNEHRVRHLAEAVASDRHPRTPMERLDGPALKLLIQLMSRSYRPRSHSRSEGAYKYTLDMQASHQVHVAIDRLGSDPSQIAGKILQSLATDDSLVPWQPDLNHAVHRQNELRRESCFRHGDIRQVIQVLDNRRPANAADLAALTTEYLRDISRNIRDGNTSDWKQYWNVDRYNRAERPKPEDACRDAILSDLKDRLKPLNIDAQPEGRYADDKRSDIRVSFGKFNVPVEIKKSCHRDLWSAIRRQLIAKYTRDPGAHGYGIYLVFWFGNTEHCRPTPGDKPPPKSAAQLDERLRDTLSEEEKRKISICVIDVAKSDIQRGKIRRDLQTDR